MRDAWGIDHIVPGTRPDPAPPGRREVRDPFRGGVAQLSRPGDGGAWLWPHGQPAVHPAVGRRGARGRGRRRRHALHGRRPGLSDLSPRLDRRARCANPIAAPRWAATSTARCANSAFFPKAALVKAPRGWTARRGGRPALRRRHRLERGDDQRHQARRRGGDARHRRRVAVRAAIRQARRRHRHRHLVERRQARPRQGDGRRSRHQLHGPARMGAHRARARRPRRRSRHRCRRRRDARSSRARDARQRHGRADRRDRRRHRAFGTGPRRDPGDPPRRRDLRQPRDVRGHGPRHRHARHQARHRRPCLRLCRSRRRAARPQARRAFRQDLPGEPG